MDWFLYDRDIRHEKVKVDFTIQKIPFSFLTSVDWHKKKI